MSKAETIVHYLEEHGSETISLLTELVKIPSINPPGDERRICAFIKDWLEKIGGFDVQVAAKSESRSNLFAHLRAAKDGSTLILCAHTDTKPFTDLSLWKHHPLEGKVDSGRLYGVGTGDMKAGIAAMMMAAKALAVTRTLSKGGVLLAFLADEESTGEMGMSWALDENLIEGDAAIIGEPSGESKGFEFIDIAARGSLLFDLIVKGDQIHSSISDIKSAVNASVKLSELVAAMAKEFKVKCRSHPLYSQGATVNLGDYLKGGTWYGTLPSECVAGCDIRIPPGTSAKNVQDQLQAFLDERKKRDPALNVTLKVAAAIDGGDVPPNSLLVSAASRAARSVLGFEPKVRGSPGYTDAVKLINRLKIPAISAFGPGLLPLAHSPNEYVYTDDLVAAATIYALASIDYLEHIET